MGSSNLEYELYKLLSGEPWFCSHPAELRRPLAGSPLGDHHRQGCHPFTYPVKSLPTEPTVCQVVIPPTYQRLPILSRLVSRFGVTVNILGAALPSWRPSKTDFQGEFVLALGGNPPQQAQAMDYLKTLKVQFVPRRDLHLPPQPYRLSVRQPVTLSRGAIACGCTFTFRPSIIPSPCCRAWSKTTVWPSPFWGLPSPVRATKTAGLTWSFGGCALRLRPSLPPSTAQTAGCGCRPSNLVGI